MRTTFAILLLAGLCGASARGADDAPPPSTIPEVIKAILGLRAERMELDKKEGDARKLLDKLLKEQQDALDLLNVKPPKPPEPKPPEPVDPLAKKLRAAFDGDPVQLDTRRGQAKDLAALYRQAAKLAQDTSVASSGELLAQVSKAAATMLSDPPPPARRNLADVRKVVALELGTVLPTDDALTDAQRKAVAELFAKLAAILESLGG
jgi:hypothetical protein